MEPIAVVRTGTANLASVLAALRRMGQPHTLTADPGRVADAPSLILPGVGSFGAVMSQLDTLGLIEPLRRRLQSDLPTLCICLGMQILAESSEESPGVRGLAIVPGTVQRFTGPVPVPQLGWNTVEPETGCTLLEPGCAYFANSYRLTDCPHGWSPAWSGHGGRFVAAMQRGNVLACQFHPELSGRWGLALLSRWLARASEEVPAC